MFNLGRLIKRGIVQASKVAEMVDKYYKPTLKAFSYAVDRTLAPPKVSIFSHAPVGLETIESFAKTYGLTYKDNDVDQLCKTIDEINIHVAQDIQSGEIHKKCLIETQKEQLLPGYNSEDPYPFVDQQFPFKRIMWNRSLADPQLTANTVPGLRGEGNKKYQLAFVCGHEGSEAGVKKGLNNLFCIDSLIGRPGRLGYHPHSRQLLIHYVKTQATPKPAPATADAKHQAGALVRDQKSGAALATGAGGTQFFQPNKEDLVAEALLKSLKTIIKQMEPQTQGMFIYPAFIQKQLQEIVNAEQDKKFSEALRNILNINKGTIPDEERAAYAHYIEDITMLGEHVTRNKKK